MRKSRLSADLPSARRAPLGVSHLVISRRRLDAAKAAAAHTRLTRLRKAGEPALSAADKEALVNIVAARTGKSQQEAEQVVDNYARAYQQAAEQVKALKEQAEQQAREAAQVAASNVSKAAWGTLVTLLIGAALSFAVGRFALSSRNIPVIAE